MSIYYLKYTDIIRGKINFKTKQFPCLLGIHIQGIHVSYEEGIMKSR